VYLKRKQVKINSSKQTWTEEKLTQRIIKIYASKIAVKIWYFGKKKSEPIENSSKKA